MRSRLRLGLLAATPLLLGGCGEMQPAVPLERSIPLATLMVGVAAAPALLVGQWLWRRWQGLVDVETGWPLPMRPVRRTALIAVVTAGIVAVPLAGLAFFLVGFSFAEAHVDVFTYGDIVGFSGAILGLATVVCCLLLGAAGGLCSTSATVRRRVRVAVWIAAALTAPLLAACVPIALVLAGMIYSSRNVAPEPVFVGPVFVGAVPGRAGGGVPSRPRPAPPSVAVKVDG